MGGNSKIPSQFQPNWNRVGILELKNHLLNHISFNQAHKICTDLIYESTNRKSFFGEKNPFFKKFLNFLLERKY